MEVAHLFSVKETPTVSHRYAENATVEPNQTTASRYVWASLRLAMGGVFFWAFIDKVFGLGYATKPANAWVNGGSPTQGFLGNASKGPFADFYHAIAGHPVTDALFMLGLAGVGVALLLGMGVKLAGYSGTAMLLLMWTAVLPPANNPVLDDHIVYAIVLLGLTFAEAGRTLGLGRWWARQAIVRRFPILE